MQAVPIYTCHNYNAMYITYEGVSPAPAVNVWGNMSAMQYEGTGVIVAT